MTGHKLFKLGLYDPCENMWKAFVTSPVGLHRLTLDQMVPGINSQFWCQAPPCFQLEGTSACMWWWYCCYWNQKPWRDPESFAVETLGTSYQHPEAFRGSAVRMLLRHLSQYRRDTILFDDSGDDDFPWLVLLKSYAFVFELQLMRMKFAHGNGLMTWNLLPQEPPTLLNRPGGRWWCSLGG